MRLPQLSISPSPWPQGNGQGRGHGPSNPCYKVTLVVQELGLVDLHMGCSTILAKHWVAHQWGD